MTSGELLSRDEFRERGLERDDGECVVPWCDSKADEVHHIIERSLWSDGGYYLNNGASVCNPHHQYAEDNYIPPQAFWRWIGVTDTPYPSDVPVPCDKWGEAFETPPHENLREFHKYPSTRHLLPLYWESDRSKAEARTGRDDTGITTVEPFVETPLVITIKMDGGNALMVKDTDEPVRPRNAKKPNHKSFDRFKKIYWDNNVYEKLPDHIQVFGEWLLAKHSIHYGCHCEPPCDDVGPSISSYTADAFPDDPRSYFQIFGIFDKRYNLWLSWPETEQWAEKLGFPTAPVVQLSDDDTPMYDTPHDFKREVLNIAENVVDDGNEGIVVRCKFPFHYGQFGERLGKFVRPHHVEDGEDHWMNKPMVKNKL